MLKYILIVLVIALLVALFAVQNAVQVDIKFYGGRFPGIPGDDHALFLRRGALAAFLLTLVKQIRATIQIRELSGLNRQLKAEIERLKGETRDNLNKSG